MSKFIARKSSAPRRPASKIVVLQDYRGARRAAYVLRGLLRDPRWLRDVTVDISDGKARLVVHLHYWTDEARLCTPTRVNSVDVELRAPSDAVRGA